MSLHQIDNGTEPAPRQGYQTAFISCSGLARSFARSDSMPIMQL